ncbi:MAG TPA: hypothetical protein VNN77_15735 [candidate division Zixibacteria bacterium]|nr:hypothetical protein [candidate division Zixibacteria bacterium]
MAVITYNLETLTGKHGRHLEVVEAIVSDGRLVLILTDEDVMEKKDAPLKGVFYRLVLPLAEANIAVKKQAFELVKESLKFPVDDGCELKVRTCHMQERSGFLGYLGDGPGTTAAELFSWLFGWRFTSFRAC